MNCVKKTAGLITCSDSADKEIFPGLQKVMDINFIGLILSFSEPCALQGCHYKIPSR
jgi:hypothetical protein